ncbi:MAG: hypothetical protein SNJ63_04155 [Sphingomonadaceae bacterium]
MQAILMAAALAASNPSIPPTDKLMIHCSQLPATARNAAAGTVIHIWGECTNLTLSNLPNPVTVEAGSAMGRGAIIRHLYLLRAHNLTWRGGIIETSPNAAAGRALDMRSSNNVTIDGVWFRNALRGFYGFSSQNLTLKNSRFTQIRVDGVNLVSIRKSRVLNNFFTEFNPRDQECTWPDGTVTFRISQRDCTRNGGVWRDGDHSDGIQMWGESEDILVQGNKMFFPWEGWAQGINNFGGYAHAFRISVIGNDVRTDHSNGITFGRCQQCLIRDNFIGKATDRAPWPVRLTIQEGDVIACNNEQPDARQHLRVGHQPCDD